MSARRIVSAPKVVEGAGFEVRRAVPAQGLPAIGPFIFFDHFGPTDISPGAAKGAPSHPHAGIETLSYLLAGQARHKDSLGNDSILEPGDVQWMRAGRGIVHDEHPSRRIQTQGGTMHGVQLWLNLPALEKHSDPEYRHIDASEIPVVEFGGGSRARLIAGSIWGAVGPLRTFGRPVLAHLSLASDGLVTLRPDLAAEIGVYVLSRRATISGQALAEGQLALLDPSKPHELGTDMGGADLLILGGDPLDAPIVRYGPFVMNTAAQIERAVIDYQSGLMGAVN